MYKNCLDNSLYGILSHYFAYFWGPGRIYLKVHGTWYLLLTRLITLLITPLNGLIGVSPFISRVITPVITTSHEPSSRVQGLGLGVSRSSEAGWGFRSKAPFR